MTKLRPPVTSHLALTQIAGLIGWEGCAAIVGKAVRTVLNWSDHDTSSNITMEAALRLDAAYLAAGGDLPPLEQWYSLSLDLAVSPRVACERERALRIAAATKEFGQAIAAAIIAGQHGAKHADRVLGRRDVEEAIAALTLVLADIPVEQAA